MKIANSVIFFGLLLSMNFSHAQLGAKVSPLPPPAKVVEGPTLDQTKEWISQKIATVEAIRNKNSDGEPASPVYINRSRIFFDECNMMVVSSQNGGQIYADYGPLEELNAEKYKTEVYGYHDRTPVVYLQILTIGERAVFLHPGFAFNGELTDPNIVAKAQEKIRLDATKGNGFYLSLPDMETAESMAKAFIHATALCKKKFADEKAAIPPRPKDLF